MEHLSDASLLRQFDTNVLGVVRMVRAVAPAMRERGTRDDHQCLLGGRPYLARRSPAPIRPASTRWRRFRRPLWFELRPFGVRVVLIEPGGFATAFGDNVITEPAFDEDSPYRPVAARFSKAMEGFRSGPPQDPQEVADLILAAATAADPEAALPGRATTRACWSASTGRWSSRPSRGHAGAAGPRPT